MDRLSPSIRDEHLNGTGRSFSSNRVSRSGWRSIPRLCSSHLDEPCPRDAGDLPNSNAQTSIHQHKRERKISFGTKSELCHVATLQREGRSKKVGCSSLAEKHGCQFVARNRKSLELHIFHARRDER